MLRADASLRSSAAQVKALGFKLAGLQTVLIAEWKLAALLQSLMDEAHGTNPRVLNVALYPRESQQLRLAGQGQSGVAIRLPPQSMIRWEYI